MQTGQISGDTILINFRLFRGELKVSACPIGACPIGSIFFAELCLIKTGVAIAKP